MRDGVTFYRSFHEAIQEEEDPEKRLAAYEAIINYALYDIEPEGLKGIAKAAFIVARPVIDSSNKASDNGKKGGAPKGNQNARKQPKTTPFVFENNPPCENETNNLNDNDNYNLNVNKKEKKTTTRTKKKEEEKHLHGEYKHVRLTAEQYDRLAADYGEETRAAAIKKLDEYIQEKPTYKSQDHNLAIRRWVIKALEEDKQKSRPANNTKFHNFDMQHNYNYEEMERQLLGG